MQQYLARIRKALWRLAVSHAVPAGNRKETVAFNYTSERTVAIRPQYCVKIILHICTCFCLLNWFARTMRELVFVS
jgi:hypothetical protein